MDFFSEVGGSQSNSAAETVDPFSEAINARFGSGSMLTARLLPSEQLNRPPSTGFSAPAFPSAALPQPMSTMSIGPISNLHFTPVPASGLADALRDPGLLLVDIRPNAAFTASRLPTALSLSVPSTLLKRPLFSLDRLAAMLPSPAARTRFAGWKSATRIVVYDVDSTHLNESSNIHGLLRKFKADGFMGDLAWLQGGFQAVWKESKSLVDASPPSPETDEDDEDVVMSPAAQSSAPGVLRVKHLPMSAFSLSSTTASASTNQGMSLTAPPTRGKNTPLAAARPAFNPFFDTIRQNTELSHGITERIPLRLPRRVRQRIGDLPFQWLQDIARRATITTPHLATPGESSESEDDDEVDAADVEEGTEALAMQFYRIELAEQRRLMGIMEHHSKESGGESSVHGLGESEASATFPFSITAGVEKGAKNRYRHIWPFEHARVLLHHKQRPSDSTENANLHDDYINASYVQPIGTKKRFIATQGPLPATFNDFWTLCWEQNVRVIVMLTREIEGAMVKCGTYWTDSTYGTLRLKLLETNGTEDNNEAESGFFAPREQAPKAPRSSTIRRKFELTNAAFPKAAPRIIIHFQYLEWPDMNVPDDPRGLLKLIREVDATVASTSGASATLAEQPEFTEEIDRHTGIAKQGSGDACPVLLHCSAGVGRTGGYIAVDSILDGVRQEIRKQTDGLAAAAMDVDDEESVPAQSPAHNMVSTGLVVPISVGARDGSDEVLHVPFAGWNETDGGQTGGASTTGSDPMKTPHALGGPMTVDQDLPILSSSQVLSPGMQVMSSPMAASPWVKEKPDRPTTQKWAETVSNETKTPSLPKQAAPPSNFFSDQPPKRGSSGSTRAGVKIGSGSSGETSSVASGPSSSAASGDFGFEAAPSSSIGTSTASIGLLREPPPKSASDPFQFSALPPDPRVRTFSVPTAAPRGAAEHSPLAGPKAMRPTKLPPSQLSGTESATSSSFSFTKLKRQEALPSDTARSSPGPAGKVSHPGGSSASGTSTRSTRVDYKEPRVLHSDASPTPLTAFDDPVCEVIQDMREQRMSLCQSLRQYVFVHAAIIEGALQVVDEEREKSGARKSPLIPSQPRPVVREIPKRKIPSHASSIPEGTPVDMPYPPRPVAKIHKSSSSASTVSSSPSKGKRMASPTELQKEDTKGAAVLSKRPSIKRKVHHGSETAGFLSPMSTGATAGSGSSGLLDKQSRSSTPQQ